MTVNLADLIRALENMAAAEGKAAADALVLGVAEPADLSKLSSPLKQLRTSEGRKVGIGDEIAAEIMAAVKEKVRE